MAAVGDAAVERRIEGLIDRCHADLDQAGLGTEVLARLPGILPVEAVFLAPVDPATLLFTSATAQEPLAQATQLFLENEFGREDVNKFAALARGRDPVTTLDRATRGRRSASPRYREIMAGLGLGDELRAALITGRECWGVLCLHLADASAGFSDRDVALVRRLAPHLAEGLRRAVVRTAARAGEAPGAPGIIVLDRDLELVSISGQAERWLGEIEAPRLRGLPLPVHAVAARLAMADGGAEDAGAPRLRSGAAATEFAARLAVADGDAGAAAVGAAIAGFATPGAADPGSAAAAAGLAAFSGAAAGTDPSGAVRLRTRDGQWLALHATRLRGPAGDQIGVIVERAAAGEVGSLLLSAHGLTPAQSRVVALVLSGLSTREIVDRLHISANTVQEHLTAVFERFGVRSRRELIAALLATK